MTFAHPIWIVAGLIICIGILFLLHRLQSARRATLEKFAAAHLVEKLTSNVSSKRQTAKKILLIFALLSCFIALARPQYGFRWEDVKRKGIDILFAVDTSKSMLVRDVKPDRLERAKYAIMDFVSQLHGDRVGLLPFAGTSYLMCPLTGDYRAFDNSLKAVDTSLIPIGGTNIAQAIKKAETVLHNEANYKLLILITDGENLQGNVLAAAKEAASKGLRIFTVGVGTREGEIIPISSGDQTKFVKDSAGNFVVSHLDESTLTKIAKIAHGIYVPLGNKGQGLQTIYQQKLALVPKEELTQRRHKVPLERYQWPLAVAIAFFSLEFIIGTRKASPFRLSIRKFSTRRKAKNVTGALLLIFMISLLAHPMNASASEGMKAYQTGDFQKASVLYDKLLKKHPDDPKLQYNYGTASYKNKKYDEAIAAFTNALKTKDLKLQEQAYYNRGNAYYRKGQETLKTDSQATLGAWRQAVDSYKASLALNKDDKDAMFNRNFVKRKIEELKKKQQNHQHNKNADQNRNKKDNKQQKQNKQEQNANQSKSRNTPQQQNGKDAGHKQQKESVNKTPNQQKQSITQARKPQKKSAQAQAVSRKEEQLRKGKMTKEDAEQLLDSLKDEEGRLNFVPNLQRNNDNTPRRDW